MTRVVLGSASRGRLTVLRNAGIDPLVVVSGVDEDAVAAGLGAGAAPKSVVGTLARAKAEAVSRDVAALHSGVASDCVVIGADSMLSVNGELRGKPGNPDVARRQWDSMAGRSGELHTGHCVIRMLDAVPVLTRTESSVTTVRFGTPTADDLEAYIGSGEPLGVAGAFTIDGLGGWFLDGVDGDPSAVVGLGLAVMRRLFESAGLTIGELWAANRRSP